MYKNYVYSETICLYMLAHMNTKIVTKLYGIILKIYSITSWKLWKKNGVRIWTNFNKKYK